MATMNAIQPLSIVVLISGTGSNLQALIEARNNGLAINIQAVISNRPNAQGLLRAKEANIATHAIDHTQHPDRRSFENALSTLINQLKPDIIVLAGFLRKLNPEFVHQYYGKMINLHPALLPKFRGLDTFSRALAAKETEHGSTIHFVSAEIDAGPIISQARFTISPSDTAEDLQRKTKTLEHRLLPHTLKLFAQQRVWLKEHHTHIDGAKICPEDTDLTEII